MLAEYYVLLGGAALISATLQFWGVAQVREEGRRCVAILWCGVVKCGVVLGGLWCGVVWCGVVL